VSTSEGLVRAVPAEPVSLDDVIQRWPKVRQSDLARFDECELGAYFNMKYTSGWSNTPQARGTIEHRVIAECIREMQRADSMQIDPNTARAILIEKVRQHGVPPEDRVHVPIAEISVMEDAMGKWAWDQALNIRDVLDTERRLEGVISYRSENGELIERVLTGQMDVMMQRGTDEMVVIDWKGALSAPPERDENEDPATPEAFFQQRFYGVLGLQNFRSLSAVVLREMYHRLLKMRAARITRERLPQAEGLIALVVEAYDAALASGPPPTLTIDALNEHGHWKPTPGWQCRLCPGRRFCPLDDEVKVGGIQTLGDAERLAGARHEAREIDAALKPHLESWARLHGPIPLRYEKGRRVLGFRPIKGGKTRFEDWCPTPEERAPTSEPAPDLAAAMRESVAEARKERTA
jgi:hypothetical protein